MPYTNQYYKTSGISHNELQTLSEGAALFNLKSSFPSDFKNLKMRTEQEIKRQREIAAKGIDSLGTLVVASVAVILAPKIVLGAALGYCMYNKPKKVWEQTVQAFRRIEAGSMASYFLTDLRHFKETMDTL